jgi:hypothetical protein
MKRAVVISLLIGFLAWPLAVEAQNKIKDLRDEMRALSARISAVEEVMDQMTKASESYDSGLGLLSVDITEDFGISLVQETLEIDHCNALGNWVVHSGAGVSVEFVQDPENSIEGAGAIKVTVPGSTTGIVKTTFAAKDLSGLKYIRPAIKRSATANTNVNLHFSESTGTYNQQSMGASGLTKEGWNFPHWTITGIADSSKNAVVLFAVTLQNLTATEEIFYIDLVQTCQYSEIQALIDGAVKKLFPKIYHALYTGTGTGSSQTVQVMRKGTPKRIDFDCVGRVPYRWHAGMASGHVWKATSAADGTWSDVTGQLTSVGDGNFVVTGNLNAVGEDYYITIVFAD